MKHELLEEMEAEAAAAVAQYVDEKTTYLARHAHKLDARLAELEAETEQTRREFDKIMKFVLPLRMAEIDLSELGFTLENGEKARLVLETKVVGSLNGAPDEDAAVEYLEKEGFSNAIKTMLGCDFTEEERDLAAQMLKIVEKDVGREVYLKRTIHPQTLMAFGRMRVVDNPKFDFEKVGLRAWPQAKFTKK